MSIAWEKDVDVALAETRTSKRPLLIDFNSEGLPLGLELDAAVGRDRDLLALARGVEQVSGACSDQWVLSCSAWVQLRIFEGDTL